MRRSYLKLVASLVLVGVLVVVATTAFGGWARFGSVELSFTLLGLGNMQDDDALSIEITAMVRGELSCENRGENFPRGLSSTAFPQGEATVTSDMVKNGKFTFGFDNPFVIELDMSDFDFPGNHTQCPDRMTETIELELQAINISTEGNGKNIKPVNETINLDSGAVTATCTVGNNGEIDCPAGEFVEFEIEAKKIS